MRLLSGPQSTAAGSTAFSGHQTVPGRTPLGLRVCAALGMTLGCAACSNQAIYDTAQNNHALECQKYPDSRYEECMATVDKDFKTYDREREALIEEQAPAEPPQP